MQNIIQIKRRLKSSLQTGIPSLSSGELAYNEKTDELYYGGEFGTITIAGSGSFVDRKSNQTVAGNKTFSGLTTLSSTTFSDNSVLDFGGNVLTNVGYPVLSSDAATKQYVVDTYIPISSSGDYVNRTTNQDISGVKSFYSDAIFKEDVSVDKNLTVTGNLSVLGTQVVVNTQTINISGISTQIDVVNNGTDTGITVNQTGEQDVAEFKDDGATALVIKGNAATPGYVGIGTATPNEKLTVVGSISATEDIFARNGDFTGTLDVDGATTLGSTLYVTSGATFALTVSAAGAVDFDSTLDVVGATTLQSTLDVTSGATFASTDRKSVV